MLTKSYGENNSIVNTYDIKDRITSTAYAGKTVNYTYDVNGQLVSANSDTYAYDSRGNITSKTVNGVTTSFTYANSGWKDLLISVDDTELEYDANGNVILYGDREFTWTYGRSLASIIDGNNEYCYTYNEDGIRTSKTVNGVTTYFNTKDGVILSQTGGINNWYFQYDTNGTPLGFVLNGVQYFYITNQMNDVLAITDTSGTIVGNYEYDAWGTVTLADTEIAQQNPIRYRGYYYDNETGYYYLQSRYYDPSICRFINADIPEITNITKNISVGTNLFAYCDNDPINYSDPTGLAKININNILSLTGILMAIYSAISALVSVALKNIPLFKLLDICVCVGSIALNAYNYFKAIKGVKRNYKKNSKNYKNLIKYNSIIFVANVAISVVSTVLGLKRTKSLSVIYYIIKFRTISIAGMCINIGELVSGRNVLYRSKVK